VAHKFGTEESTRVVVVSRELVVGRLSPVFSAEAVVWQLHTKEDGEAETVVRRWLMAKDTDCCQY